jgi:hypothetical protein
MDLLLVFPVPMVILFLEQVVAVVGLDITQDSLVVVVVLVLMYIV